MEKLNGSDGVDRGDLMPTGLVANTANEQEGDGEEGGGERGNWSGKLDFVLSCVSYAVGLGNIWRFPFLCFEDGGGAFLIPYVIMMLVVGMPIFYLEMAMGQFSSLGCLGVWKCTPLAKGLGYGMVIMTFFVATFYNVIIAYALFYLFASFTKELPWKTCDNYWNSPNCRVTKAGDGTGINDTLLGDTFVNDTYGWPNYYDTNGTASLSDSGGDPPGNGTAANGSFVAIRPSEEYFNNRVLDMSDGIEDLGVVKWDLTLCLLLAWLIVFLSLAKGIQSSGKVVYVTSTFPYFVLVALFIRGITLEGAMDGIIFYMRPDPVKLLLPKVWQDAAVQVFFSLGCSFGTLHTLSSYNTWHQNSHKDAVIVAWLDCFTSIFGGFVVFSVLGFMAHDAGTTVDKVVASGPGLAFIAYPEAIARMPLAPLWSILFFIMVFMLGIGSEFTLFEAIITGLVDDLEGRFKNLRKYKTLVTLILCVVCFLLGLPMVTQGGIHIVTLMNAFAANISLLLVSTLEVIIVGHFYGVNTFLEDLKHMVGFKLNVYWKISWWIVTPITLMCLVISSIVVYTPLTYGNGDPYPGWALALGWLLTIISLVPPLVYPVYHMCGLQGTILERIRISVKPTADWGPRLNKHRREAGYQPIRGTDPEECVEMIAQHQHNKHEISM